MSVSRSRAVYRVLRHRLPRVITARRKASPRDAVGDGGDAAFAPQRRRDPSSHLALIVGHFSFDDWYATFGDTEAMRIVMSWLDEAGVPFDVACHPVNGLTGVDFWHVDPLQYTIVVFVCGPWNQERHDTILRRFGHCVKIGVNLSVVEPGDHGFDLLFARDRLDAHNPDLVFASNQPSDAALAGLFMVHEQPEYGDRQQHALVKRALDEYLSREEVLAVPLDTIHVGNRTSASSASQLISVLRRLDVVLTTRLHGFVFSLVAGTPAVAIDPVTGGGKVTAQAEAVGWPVVLSADEVTPDEIGAAVRRCLNGAVKTTLAESLASSRQQIERIHAEFVSALAPLDVPGVGNSPEGNQTDPDRD